MPKPLVILFWIWLLISVGIYLSRFYRRMTSSSVVDENETSGETSSDELPLDAPERWTQQSPTDEVDTHGDKAEADISPTESAETPDDQTIGEEAEEAAVEGEDADTTDPVPTAAAPETPLAQPVPATHHAELSPEPAVAAALAEQASDEAGLTDHGSLPVDEGLPVGDLAARLDPLVDESHIEPSVLSAMSPTQRAAMGVTAATASGGLFDPQVRTLVDDVEYDHKPLSELLTGIALPCDLLPTFRQASNEHYAIFTTTSAGVAEVAAKVATELEHLGFTVSPRPPSGARATRDTSAIDIVVSLLEESDERTASVEIEFSSL